jgi:hypothetical protein
MAFLFIYFSVGFTFVKEVVMFFPVIFSSICNFEVTHIQSTCHICVQPLSRSSPKGMPLGEAFQGLLGSLFIEFRDVVISECFPRN